MLSSATPMGFLLVTDRARARAFYEGLLGLGFVDEDDFALVLCTGPIHVRLTTVEAFKAADHTVFGWQVADIGGDVAALAAAGVAFERYPFFGDAQGPDGIWSSPGGARVAWFRDPDGNLLSLSQHGT
ncbi:VOC family protein [Asticcacaulis solisilvae]|uniref:VOC family protein n=1 Tax=Asticcacaulis solisilvae TaxID=1217274 RepID=UPI003FD6E530